MAFAGLRGTGDWATDERPKNFREMILWRSPNGQAPLTALLAKMASEKVDDPEFNWWEEELAVTRLQVNGVMNTTTTTAFVVDADALLLVPGDMLLVETSDATTAEIVRVNGVASDTSFDVIRAQGGTSAAAIPDNTFITRIGNSYAEGSTSPSVSNRNPTKKTNFLQIFKTAYQITNTAKQTRTRTGDPLKNDKKRKMFDHSTAMEFAFLFGKPIEFTGSNNKPQRLTGGLRHFITTNATVFSTTPTETTFINAVAPVFDFDGGGGNERIIFCGNGALTSLNKLAKSGMQVRVDEVVKLYGMQLQRWILPQGTFLLRSHPLMNTHGRYTNSMFIVDPSALKYRFLRDTKMEDNIQANDADEQKGQWLTECGLEIRHQRTMAYLGNFVV
ncbi:MAG: SU10 major capsid protein [Minisyncoccota bacterium]